MLWAGRFREDHGEKNILARFPHVDRERALHGVDTTPDLRIKKKEKKDLSGDARHSWVIYGFHIEKKKQQNPTMLEKLLWC